MTKKQRIVLVSQTYSGCNSRALYQSCPRNIQEKYEVRLINEPPYLEYDQDVRDSHVVITTHANYPFNKEQINIDLWHGFPLKGMANMDSGDPRSPEQLLKHWNDVDIITSYSAMFNTLFNACIGTKVNKYQITGAPRNDYLYTDVGKRNLSTIFKEDFENSKVIFYMPTFRSVSFNSMKKEGNRHWDNLFSFNTFNMEEFLNFLEKNNLRLVVKLHPVEEGVVREHLLKIGCERIHVLTDSVLQHNNMDLYQLLNGCDLLITDYSSVYFDFLLLNRPIIFAPIDLNEYKQSRGFLLEPYESWTPGPKVYAQHELEAEILRSLGDKDYYINEREQLTKIVHHYQDGQASKRIWSMIENLVDSVASSSNKQEEIQIELDTIKKRLKEEIKLLIEKGQTTEANKILKECEQTIGLDLEMITMKASVLFIENKLDEALNVLEKGYFIDKEHFDILYNLGYINHFMQRNDWAIYYYSKALKYCKDTNLQKDIEKSIHALKSAFPRSQALKKVLIGSPVHQKPEILQNYLESLEELNKEGVAVDYFFVDDNNDHLSSGKLQTFAESNNVFILSSFHKDQYICDNNTHHWNTDLVWKVAEFKNDIIEFAIFNDYDYLFLIDSDLVLHPKTLNKLISAEKDIISNIFWTKWTDDVQIELPQVWLKDNYTLYSFNAKEKLTQSEINQRTAEFIGKLRRPGIYKVGGLGACTLISRKALEAGVNFSEIPNISFWGEDRHFCIRAEVLGFELFVDTHYPAFHIYRESDLEKVPAFKKNNKLEESTEK
ncbi:CDP-glycerol:poly(glycerophosphate) glycerophosphotransferase [Chlamydia abortus]|nr:CDP-glycerol:poly(glycerophosphate) glycerophosphotransferase [Chlamydia abortus]